MRTNSYSSPKPLIETVLRSISSIKRPATGVRPGCVRYGAISTPLRRGGLPPPDTYQDPIHERLLCWV